MRPFYILLSVFISIIIVDIFMTGHLVYIKKTKQMSQNTMSVVVSSLGLTDLCISTEARYTRHPAVTDPIVPFMDHPGAIEHFPSGSFWAPPPYLVRDKNYEGIAL